MSNDPQTLTNLPEWKTLQAHFDAQKSVTVSARFDDNPTRFHDFHTSIDGLHFDYSKHKIDTETIALLCDLATARGLDVTRELLYSGGVVNTSENRAALHMALRGSAPKSLMMEGENVAEFVHKTHMQMRAICDDIRNDPGIKDVVNIGIGGSDLGPRLVCRALDHLKDGPNLHFIANIDGAALEQLFEHINPENTVFIIASKSFTTLETIINAQTSRDWMVGALGEHEALKRFYAVTKNTKAAHDFGIEDDRILPIKDWIGGRYSVWGAVGLPIALQIGFAGYEAFLDGAHAMDTHFMEAPFTDNIPILMGLIGVWYRNFYDYSAHCVMPYDKRLASFPSYIQQIDMESNGKRVTGDGGLVDYHTGPLVFGDKGTNAQHAFFQSLHQGTQVIPVDFIAAVNADHNFDIHHQALLASALAQSKALMEGRRNTQDLYHDFPGNRPSSTLLLERFDPHHMGMLMALYEHKVFVQGVIWGINSFDQMGVELGKKLTTPIMDALASGVTNTLDASTSGLIDIIAEKFIKS